MPEQGSISISETPHDTGGALQVPSGTERHFRELATKFSKTQMVEQDGGLLIKGVPMLAAGTWTDSAVGTPLTYPESTLREYAGNWIENTGWSRHLGGIPRDITDKVAELRDPRYENGAVTGDIFVHGATQKSRDTMELVKRKLISYVSVEHGGDERFNPATRQMEASTLSFLGFAFVNKGACKLCRINETLKGNENPAPSAPEVSEPIVEQVEIMETKELEAQIAALTKEIGELKAVKPEVKVEVPKELSESIKDISTRLKKIEDTPLPAATTAAQTKELAQPSFRAIVDKKTGEVYGA